MGRGFTPRPAESSVARGGKPLDSPRHRIIRAAPVKVALASRCGGRAISAAKDRVGGDEGRTGSIWMKAHS